MRRTAGERYTILADSLLYPTGGNTRSSNSSTIKMMALSIKTFTGKNASEYLLWSLSYISDETTSMFTLHCLRLANRCRTILAPNGKESTCLPSTGAFCRQRSIGLWSRPLWRVGSTSTLNYLSPSAWIVQGRSLKPNPKINLISNPTACLPISLNKILTKKITIRKVR